MGSVMGCNWIWRSILGIEALVGVVRVVSGRGLEEGRGKVEKK